MAHQIKKANIFGRIGSGFGQGLAEQLPKEMERNRLSAGLRDIAQQKDLTPFQQFAALSSVPGITPQMVQSGSDLLRQQSIINSLKQDRAPSPEQTGRSFDALKMGPSSATTVESTQAALNPYIPPSGQQQEQMARQLMSREPQVYPSIESARQAVSSQVGSDIQQSNARLAKRELEESVQRGSEGKLKEELATVGAQIPGTLMSRLQQRAVEDTRQQKMTPDEAKVKYGKEADEISRVFSNIKSWGGLDLVLKDSKDLFSSISALQKKAKQGGYQKEAADAMIADNQVTPQLAYASMYPVRDVKPLNDFIKKLPDISSPLQTASTLSILSGGAIGLLGQAYKAYQGDQSSNATLKIVPQLAKEMGLEGSPLSIAYELEKKGYDPQVWKQYLVDNQDNMNLTSHQIDELQKSQPGFYGQMNDMWFKSFSGVK